jgi:hypothetical protein
MAQRETGPDYSRWDSALRETWKATSAGVKIMAAKERARKASYIVPPLSA